MFKYYKGPGCYAKPKPIFHVCANCGQYQTKFKGHYDCFNDCVKRGFALEPTGGEND